MCPPFAVSPDSVNFPRASAQGPGYGTNVECRSRSGRPFGPAVQAAHRDFAGENLLEEPRPVHVFRVVYRGPTPVREDVRGSIRFTATEDGRAEECRLNVSVKPPAVGAD